MAKVTNKDIAQRAGVSPATVSMALHGKKGISEETRKQILEIAQELNYAPPAKVRLGAEGAIVLLSDTLSGYAAQFVLKGLTAYAMQQNTELRLLTLPQVMENLSGTLAGCSLLVTFDVVERSLLDRLSSRVPRILVIDSSFARKPFFNIRIDYSGAAYSLTRYLADSGHRSFIYLNQDLPSDKNLICFSGFQRLILEQHLLLNPKQIIMDASSDPNVWSHFPEIIRSGNISAVICTSEAAAIEATNRLVNSGFQVPKDVSVAAITADDSAVYPLFSFTRISLGLDRIQEEIRKLASDGKPSAVGEDIFLMPEPVRQGSSSGSPKFNPATKKLAIALYLKDHPTMRLARAGFLNKVQQMGYQAEVVGTTKGDVASYVESCKQLVELRPDGVALWLPEQEVVDLLHEKGIPVVTLHSIQGENGKHENKAACNIAANPISIARNVAKYLAEKLKGRRGMIAVTQSDDNLLETGITEEFTRQMQILCPEITVVQDRYFFRHSEQNTTLVKEFIRNAPELLASFSTAGDACITWAEAKKALNRPELIVVGTDYTEETVALLENGEVQAFVAQPVYEEAQMSVEALDAALRGNDYPIVCQLDAPLVTVSNVDKYRRLLQEVQNWYA